VNYDSPKAINSLLNKRGLKPTKKFGQNFLISRDAREKIISILDPGNDEIVWEIGPGIGAMTHMLVGKIKKLIVFEIDRGFIQFLSEEYSDSQDFKIIPGDVVKTWQREMNEDGIPDLIFGNLPYNTAATIITHLIQKECIPQRMVFTIQKEVAQRMVALPGTKDYSSFSMISQLMTRVIYHGDLNPGSFYPAPGVVSSIIELIPDSKYELPKDKKLTYQLIRTLFASRRKTIKNNLMANPIIKEIGLEQLLSILEKENISPKERGENLSISQVVSLSKSIGKVIG
jgi:16S rRNA (adenine1518-N6/adenine1519-N6)-dimethyltransferase